MIAGVVIGAAGDLIVVADPLGRARPAWVAAILSGPALFLAGRALLDYTVFAGVPWSRVSGMFVLAAVSPALLHAPPLATAVVATLVLAGIVVVNTASWRRRPVPVGGAAGTGASPP